MKALFETFRAQGVELVSSYPITTGQPFKAYTMFTIPVTDIKAGDKLNAFGGYSVTMDAGTYAVMCCCFITITDAPLPQGSSIPIPPPGIVIDPASGQNISKPAIHHYRTRLHGEWLADQDYALKYVNFCGYSASTATLPGHMITVDQGYGKAWVDLYREIPVVEPA